MTLVDDFLTWAELDRRRSQHTLARYRAVLAQINDPATATVEDIEAWWVTRYGAAPATRENELACLRSFYRWAMRFDHRADDPTRRLDAPSIPRRVPRPVGESEVSRLLGPLTDDAPDLRRAIALGVYGGLRVSEAASLDWRQVDTEARRIYVLGKGDKERVIGLSPVLLDKILPDTGGNVVTAGARPYTGAVLQRKVNRLMQRHSIEHTFHDLRKRGAGLAMAKSGNPQAVAQFFGWASLQTVTHYAVVGDEELDRIAAAMI